MKTRTNQPVFLDNGNPVNDNALGGTKLYRHTIDLLGVDDTGETDGQTIVVINNDPASASGQMSSENLVVYLRSAISIYMSLGETEFAFVSGVEHSYDNDVQKYRIRFAYNVSATPMVAELYEDNGNIGLDDYKELL